MDVRGRTESSSLLRVVDSEGRLYDQVWYFSYALSSVDAVVYGREDSAAYLEEGVSSSVVFRLKDEFDGRLLDSSMTIVASVEFTPVSWDCIDVVGPENADAVTFTVTAAGRTWPVVIPVR